MTSCLLAVLAHPIYLSLWATGLGFFCALIRMVRGPSLSDRVVALDLMATLAVGFAVSYAMLTRQSILLDIATVVALLGFLGTVAFARWYLEKGIRHD
jgi:multicomponent Na+:H+ antiporter subunit F